MLPRPVRGRRRAAAVVAAIAVGSVVAACSGSKHEPQALPSATPSATPTPSPSDGTYVATLNGAPAGPGPVVVIKVDNSTSARPLQRGFGKAPLVYQEIIEGQATRFAVVFDSPVKAEIGPIRSARDTDIELFAEYGPVIFGFSGANRNVLAHVKASPLIAVYQEGYGSAYTQKGRRAEAYNFFTSASRLIKAAPRKGVGVHDVGLRFGKQPIGGVAVTGRTTVLFNGASYVTFRYNAARQGWLLTQNGRSMRLYDGSTIAPQNVIVQFVPVVKGRYRDVLGNNSPDTRSIGKGRVSVFRDGRRFDGTWSRPTRSAGTHFLTAAGTDIPLHPGGQTWVLLVPTNGRITGS
jgi:hypothetical protein